MKIDSLKDLKQVIKLCRETGVDSIKVDGIELHLGAKPNKVAKRQPIDYAADFPEADISVPKPNLMPENVQEYVQDVIETSGLSEEDLLFLSSDGIGAQQ